MARRRFFVDQIRNGQAEITGDEAHHLSRVLRVEAGQKYEISDTGRVWLAEVETVRKSLVRFTIVREMESGPEMPELTLYLALIKFDRFEWAVEKATELGVTRIVPVETVRSERGLFEGSRKRVERWRKIAREASEQSRRLRPPEIADPVKIAAALREESSRRIVLDEQPGLPSLLSQVEHAGAGTVALMTGPEGGWVDSERAQFAAAGWSAASLGPLVLRAETAVCAALAVIAQVRLEGAPIQSGEAPVSHAS